MKRLEHWLDVGPRRLRCGYTTGTAAAAAACAAARLLLTGKAPRSVLVDTPAGLTVEVEVEQVACDGTTARCTVVKDAGDDPDVTDGVHVVAAVTRVPSGFPVDGGEGVGRVTLPGLDQPVGEAAINSVPRRMIAQQLRLAAEAAGYAGGLRAIISIPEGTELAAKTFNPRLGIVGGVSVLGTTGIVRPMSEEALLDTLRAELNLHYSMGERRLLLTPGAYGAAFCAEHLGLNLDRAVQCSNYIGAALDHAALLGYESVLLVGHAGKLVKCAAGVMNTHSRVADARRETIAAHAALCGADAATIAAVVNSPTTDAALTALGSLRGPVMKRITAAVGQQLRRRAGERMQVEAVIFSNTLGLLGQTPGAAALLERHRKEH